MVIAAFAKQTIESFANISCSEDLYKFVAKSLFEERIQSLSNLTGFIQKIDADVNFSNYLDNLLKFILHPLVSQLLLVAAIKLITDFPKTARNKQRISSHFRTMILNLRKDLDLHPLLKECIDKFCSVWELLSMAKVSLRRNAYNKSFNEGNINRYTKTVETISNTQKKEEIVLFGLKVLNLDVKPPHCDLETENGYREKIPLVDQNIVKFCMEKPLVFSKYPFQETLYIQNTSTNEEHRFYLQIFPTDFFSVVPASGILKSGESLALKVEFTQNQIHPHIIQAIHGFIRIRSMTGLPLERYGILNNLYIIG